MQKRTSFLRTIFCKRKKESENMQCSLLGFKVIRNERWEMRDEREDLLFFSFDSPHHNHAVVVIGMCQSWIRCILPLPPSKLIANHMHIFPMLLFSINTSEWVGHHRTRSFLICLFTSSFAKPIYLFLHLTTDSCGICQFIRFSPHFSAIRNASIFSIHLSQCWIEILKD